MPAEEESLAGRAHVEQLLGPGPRYWHGKASSITGWREVKQWPAERLRETALCLHAMACGGHLDLTAHGSLLCGLSELDIPWTVEDLAWCLTKIAGASSATQERLDLELPSAIAAGLPAEALAPFEKALSAELEWADQFSADRRRRILSRLGPALDRARGETVPSWILNDADDFGATARPMVVGRDCRDLLTHCVELASVTPNTKWRKQIRQLMSSAGTASLAVGLVEAFGSSAGNVLEDNDRLARGLLWAIQDDSSDDVTSLLVRATVRAAGGYPDAPRTAIAGVRMLTERGGDHVINSLARLSLTVRHNAVLSRVRAALEELGAARGWSLAEVMELAVDDHGLDADGRHVETIDGYEVVVRLDDDRARLTFSRDGKPLKSAPVALKDETKRLRELAKRIDKTLAAERQRVESLLSREREWSSEEWVERYLKHPVTSRLGRRLIWQAKVDGAWQSGLPDNGRLRTLDGEVVVGERIRLWHPLRATVGEVSRWRDHVMGIELRQPFKQAFREVYPLTPAERSSATHSMRFAGHILRYRQANALMRVRGWRANYLGGWDGGYEGDATKEFDGGAWRASFRHRLAGTDQGEATFCATAAVTFARREGAVWAAAGLAEVPELVFSEAMRDIDLFVGVTSIATEPEWTEEIHYPYWRTAGFGELTPSAEMRRDALARLLPRTKLAGKVELGERFLRVQGVRHAYRIHLGSGNILLEPHDSYLCVVAGRTPNLRLHLPFEEDAMLSTILSKAFLLAADDKITDPSILRQLR